eukprot:scaffold4372_cov397-Prasinococcus_capsulatus_cf.AAC.36
MTMLANSSACRRARGCEPPTRSTRPELQGARRFMVHYLEWMGNGRCEHLPAVGECHKAKAGRHSHGH